MDKTTEPLVVALIPARGGSKGLPGKNIRLLAGKPLIAHTIQAARSAKGVNRVIVSTDDPQIAEAAVAYGAEVPFMRPAELAQDGTSAIAVVLHALRWLETQEDCRPDYIVYLQPTSPLREAADIDAALSMARDRNADSVTSLSLAKQHPYSAAMLGPDGMLQSFAWGDWRELQRRYTSRQQLPPAYVENGAIYVVSRAVALGQETFYGDRLAGYVMSEERSIDIDTAMDFALAERLLGGLPL